MNIAIEETRKHAIDHDLVPYPIKRVIISRNETGVMSLLIELRDPTPANTTLLDNKLSAYLRACSLDGEMPPDFKHEVLGGQLIIGNDIKQALESFVHMKLLNQQTINEAFDAHPELKVALERNAVLCQRTREVMQKITDSLTLLSPPAASQFKSMLLKSIASLEESSPPAPTGKTGFRPAC